MEIFIFIEQRLYNMKFHIILFLLYSKTVVCGGIHIVFLIFYKTLIVSTRPLRGGYNLYEYFNYQKLSPESFN